MRKIRKDTQAGSHVFADAVGNVYILAEQSSTTAALLRAHANIHVGLYASAPAMRWPARSTQLYPDARDLELDLIRHFLRVGFITASMIYDEARLDP